MDSQRHVWNQSQSFRFLLEGGGAWDQMADETERGKFQNTKGSSVYAYAS